MPCRTLGTWCRSMRPIYGFGMPDKNYASALDAFSVLVWRGKEDRVGQEIRRHDWQPFGQAPKHYR